MTSDPHAPGVSGGVEEVLLALRSLLCTPDAGNLREGLLRLEALVEGARPDRAGAKAALPQLRRVGRLLAHAARFQRGWAECAGLTGAYTRSGEVVLPEAAHRISVEV